MNDKNNFSEEQLKILADIFEKLGLRDNFIGSCLTSGVKPYRK